MKKRVFCPILTRVVNRRFLIWNRFSISRGVFVSTLRDALTFKTTRKCSLFDASWAGMRAPSTRTRGSTKARTVRVKLQT